VFDLRINQRYPRATLINSSQKKSYTGKQRRSNMTFTDMEYAGVAAEDSMESIIPWAAFIEAIEPVIPSPERPGSSRCVLVWFNLADEALTYMTDKEIYETGLVVVPDAAEVPPPA
jgi:hypothetical protein